MRFLMFPFGYDGAIVTDDYDESEIASDVHIAHLRRDVVAFGLNYPCRVFDFDMNPICTLTHSKVIKC